MMMTLIALMEGRPQVPQRQRLKTLLSLLPNLLLLNRPNNDLTIEEMSVRHHYWRGTDRMDHQRRGRRGRGREISSHNLYGIQLNRALIQI